MDDRKEFEETLGAMKAVTMKGKEIEATLKMVALVVHLLNVTFKPLAVKGAEGSKVEGDSLGAAMTLAGVRI